MDDRRKDNNNPMTEPPKTGYPKAVFFIIGNEFCERFSYYGMKAILVLYFTNVLGASKDTATLYYHLFAMLTYFTPVLGAIIADSFWGKFKTIFYISILYAFGNIVLSIASALNSQGTSIAITAIGLTLIAFGTGGIKPCVASFGGDQFAPGQEKQLQRFFSFFYISINAGSLLSTAITPILREDVKCINGVHCFPLAFGVPAVLMVVALVLFVVGRYLTKYKMVSPKGNIVVMTVKVICHALGKKMFGSEKKEHWLDHAVGKYDKKLVTDIKALMRVLFLYIPIPIFWALFDQQGSRWTLQAGTMDGDFFGAYRIKPDQMQVINPLLIVLMIPLFEYVIYPCFEKIGLGLRPLQRIVIGGLLAAAAFIICAFFQLRIETDLPIQPKTNEAYVVMTNSLPCDVYLSGRNFSEVKIDSGDIYNFESQMIEKLNLKIRFGDQLEECKSYNSSYNESDFNLSNNLKEKENAVFLIYKLENAGTKISLKKYSVNDLLTAPKESKKVTANLLIVFSNISIPETNEQTFSIFQLKSGDKTVDITMNKSESDLKNYGRTFYQHVEILKETDSYQLFNKLDNNSILSNIKMRQGGGYIILVTNSRKGKFLNIVSPNSVKMLFQVIQYVVMTAGEIMFSITGVEFSYSQAPVSMKAVLQAGWLLTVAFGNLIVAIITEVKIFDDQSKEFFFYAGLMILDMAILAIMAFFYVPYKGESIDEDAQSESQASPKINGKNGYSSESYTNKAYNAVDEDTTKF